MARSKGTKLSNKDNFFKVDKCLFCLVSAMGEWWGDITIPNHIITHFLYNISREPITAEPTASILQKATAQHRGFCNQTNKKSYYSSITY